MEGTGGLGPGVERASSIESFPFRERQPVPTPPSPAGLWVALSPFLLQKATWRLCAHTPSPFPVTKRAYARPNHLPLQSTQQNCISQLPCVQVGLQSTSNCSVSLSEPQEGPPCLCSLPFLRRCWKWHPASGQDGKILNPRVPTWRRAGQVSLPARNFCSGFSVSEGHFQTSHGLNHCDLR